MKELIDELEFMVTVQRQSYRFNMRNKNEYTDYSNGWQKGYLEGMEEMLAKVKGMVNDKNGKVEGIQGTDQEGK